MRTNQARAWQSDYVQTSPKQKKVVVKVKRNGLITRGEKVIYSFIALTFIVACFYIVSFSSTTDTLNRDVQALERDLQQQAIVNEGLLFEVKELSKPERITKIAKKNGLKIQDAEVKRANALNN